MTLIDLSGAGRLVLDEDGRLLDANEGYVRLAGRAHLDELRGRRISEWIAEESREVLAAELRRCLEQGSCRDLVHELVHPGGQRVPVECNGLVLDSDEGRRILAIYKDVSHLRRAARDLSDRDARMQAFMETAVDGIVTIDERGTVESFNPAAERMFGYQAGEVVGRNIRILMPSPYHEEHDGYLERYLKTGERRIIGIGREVLGRRKDGSIFPLTLSVAEMWIDGRRKYSGLLHDLSSKKQLEERYLQAQKMEAVGRLASGIAHDFNNLLMGIQGCCRMATAELGPSAPASGSMREILDAAERGTALTRQLLAFSRQRVLEPRPIRVNEALSSAEIMLRHLLGEDVTLRIELAPEGGPILGDEGQIEQILMNLAVNARDAMPGGGTLSIRSEELDSARDMDPRLALMPPGRWVLVEVVDTGTGMDGATLARAFEPFFTTKPEGKGTGLGLATTYGIVRQLEGHIELVSQPGEGTLVRLLFPRHDAAETEGAAPAGPSAEGPRSLDVLLVEDDRLVRRGLEHLLSQMGHRVVGAASADEALARCAEAREVDLLLTDIVMPGMGGPELAREIRRLRPDARVLFMSAFPGEVLVEQGRLEPGEPTIEKPFTEELLERRLRDIFEAT